MSLGRKCRTDYDESSCMLSKNSIFFFFFLFILKHITTYIHNLINAGINTILQSKFMRCKVNRIYYYDLQISLSGDHISIRKI